MDRTKVAKGVSFARLEYAPAEKFLHLILCDETTLYSVQSGTDIPLAPIQAMLKECPLVADHGLYIVHLPLVKQPLVFPGERCRGKRYDERFRLFGV
jgi:hypothetical protein